MTIRNEIPSLPVRVQTLGTGGPRPDPERAGPATVVKIGDETLLFDVGRGVVVQMVRAGIALESLKDVFITHHHFDHIGDLFDVALSTWLHGRRHALSFRGPPDTKRIMNALLTQVYDKDIEWRSDGEPTHGGWSAIDTVDVAPGLVAETERWRVFAESVVHGHGLEFSRAFLKRWICYGYRVETQARSWPSAGTRSTARGCDAWPRMPTCWSSVATWPMRRLRMNTSAISPNTHWPVATPWARSQRPAMSHAGVDPSSPQE